MPNNVSTTFINTMYDKPDVCFSQNVEPAGIEEYYEWKWTLLIQAHSPKYGKTEGTTGWSYKSTYVVGPYGSTSSLSHSVTLLPEDGKCVGRFQLAEWKYVHVYQPRPPTHRRYWYIVNTQNWFVTLDIHNSSTTTCSDDVESISWSGYNSIRYTARYVNQDRREDNPSSSWYYITLSANAGSVIQADVSISVQVKNLTVGIGVFKLENIDTQTWIYKYWFGPQHSWSIDYLDSTGRLWAFKLNW